LNEHDNYVYVLIYWENGSNEAISSKILCVFAYANDVNEGSHYQNSPFLATAT